MSRLSALLVLAAAASAVVPAARAAEAVKVRTAIEKNHARLAFDWATPVGYDVKLDGPSLVIHFERAAAADLAGIAEKLGGFIADARFDAAGTTLTATLRQPVTLRSFADGGSISIDLAADTIETLAELAPAAEAVPTPAPVAAKTEPAAAGEDRPAVALRFGEHEDYRRLAFDWKRAVNYTVEESAGEVRLHFARPAALDLDRINADMPDVKARLTDDGGGTTLTLQVPADTKTRHFVNGATVVLDLLGKPPAVPKTAEAPPPKAVTETTPPKAASETTPAKAAAPAKTASGKSAPPAKQAAATPNKSVTPPPELTAAAPAETPAAAAEEQPAAPPPPQRLVPPSAGVTPPEMAAPATSVAPPDIAAPPALVAAPASAVAPVVPPVPAATATVAAHYTASNDVASLRFAWSSPVPMAVFRRAGALWIVFGAGALVDLVEIQERGKAAIELIEQVPSPGATVLRLATRRGLQPTVRRVDDEWIVELKPQELHPDVAIGIAVEPGAQPPRVVYDMREAGEPITILDPGVGDRLLVLPTLETGRGMPTEQSVLEFRALVSAQGLVLRPNQDGLIARPIANGVEVTSAEGLMLSRESDRLLGSGTVAARLFDFPAWQGPERQSFLERRSELERVVAAAPLSRRSQPRMALAEFYFARLYAAESLGVLDAIERDDPTFAADKLVRAMRGAAALMNGDRDQASKELKRPMLDKEPEAALWRGALAARDGDWREAAQQFAPGVGLLNAYPKTLRNRFALAAAEALVRTGASDGAGALLEMVRKSDPGPGERAMARYLEGMQAKAKGDVVHALEVWQQVARSDDRPSRARALKEQTMALLQDGRISRAEAIQQLDALRYSWRGDAFEFELLHDLATLLIADGDYRRGIDLLHQAIGNFPNHPETPTAQREMADAFTAAFTGKGADRVSPLKALALYGEFKELVPTGAAGDALIRKLADRLIAVDLLDQADTLLQDEVANRLSGAPKARTATELATIRLLDHRPEAALAALDIAVGAGDVPVELARQRQQLRARALIDLGKVAPALDAIGKDSSRDADRLRADIYWKSQSWPDVARTLERLVEPAADGKLDKTGARMVLNWAAALTLAGDQPALAKLREKFGAGMATSPYAEAFLLIAAGDGAKASGDPRDRALQIAGLAGIKGFAAELRDSLAAPKADGVN